MNRIRQSIQREEFDYGALTLALREYRRPRDKISSLLSSKQILRVKKGLYIFGPDWSRRPASKEVLANLIHGPSYVSLDYALAFYGLIPERVSEITSVTSRSSKVFKTFLGTFSYKHLSLARYSVGLRLEQYSEGEFFLIASREKALADKLALSGAITKQADLTALEQLLVEDLRINIEELRSFDKRHMYEVARVYRSKNVDLLLEFIVGVV